MSDLDFPDDEVRAIYGVYEDIEDPVDRMATAIDTWEHGREGGALPEDVRRRLMEEVGGATETAEDPARAAAYRYEMPLDQILDLCHDRPDLPAWAREREEAGAPLREGELLCALEARLDPGAGPHELRPLLAGVEEHVPKTTLDAAVARVDPFAAESVQRLAAETESAEPEPVSPHTPAPPPAVSLDECVSRMDLEVLRPYLSGRLLDEGGVYEWEAVPLPRSYYVAELRFPRVRTGSVLPALVFPARFGQFALQDILQPYLQAFPASLQGAQYMAAAVLSLYVGTLTPALFDLTAGFDAWLQNWVRVMEYNPNLRISVLGDPIKALLIFAEALGNHFELTRAAFMDSAPYEFRKAPPPRLDVVRASDRISRSLAVRAPFTDLPARFGFASDRAFLDEISQTLFAVPFSDAEVRAPLTRLLASVPELSTLAGYTLDLPRCLPLVYLRLTSTSSTTLYSTTQQLLTAYPPITRRLVQVSGGAADLRLIEELADDFPGLTEHNMADVLGGYIEELQGMHPRDMEKLQAASDAVAEIRVGHDNLTESLRRPVAIYLRQYSANRAVDYVRRSLLREEKYDPRTLLALLPPGVEVHPPNYIGDPIQMLLLCITIESESRARPTEPLLWQPEDPPARSGLAALIVAAVLCLALLLVFLYALSAFTRTAVSVPYLLYQRMRTRR